jgi:hypothetical protein
MTGEPSFDGFSSAEAYLKAHEEFHDSRTPSRLQVLDRATRLGGNAMRAVDLQIRRIRTVEPEDEDWIARKWTDFQFLILALWGVRQAGQLGQHVEPELTAALTAFDRACPDLATMRNVSQHLDEYGIDGKGRRQKRSDGYLIGRRSLEVGSWDEDRFIWLDRVLEVTQAREAAVSLYSAIRTARDHVN